MNVTNVKKNQKQKNIIFLLLIILAILLLIATAKQVINTIRISYFLKTPFESVEVLDTKMRLKQEVRTYEETLDCSSLNSENKAFYYRLKENYRHADVNVNEYIFKNDTLLKENFSEATNLIIIADIKLNKAGRDYQEIYNIKVTCTEHEQQKEEKEIEKEETKIKDNNKTSTNKTSKTKKSSNKS